MSTLTQKVLATCVCLVLASSSASAAEMSADLKPAHVLNRLGYGPRPGDLQAVKAMGVDAYIQQQLNPASLSEPASLTEHLQKLTTLNMKAADLARDFGPQNVQNAKKSSGDVRTARERLVNVAFEASEARIARALESPRQLEEVMVDFWYNHFNVFAKGHSAVWVGVFERDAIRPHALGKFRTLLGATARHPAMLFYLDNIQNTAPGSPGANKKKMGLNENYARELMELHTLGVDGGYTQADVITLARILTGWGYRAKASGSMFLFEAQRHDFGKKVFLGRPIVNSGVAEGDEALDILASHPSTAKYIAFKLAQYFVSDVPPPALVDRLAKRFSETDGDIRLVLQALFASPEFWDSAVYGAKFKSPYRYVLSTLRAAGKPIDNVRPITAFLRQMGMPLYGCQTPDGYKDTQGAWLNSDGMLRRLSFVTNVASGGMMMFAGGWVPLDAENLKQTVSGIISPTTLAKVDNAPSRVRAALVLGSPELMKR